MIRRLATAYAASWAFLLWSALMICAGAAWMLFAVAAALRVRGIL